MKLYLSSQSSAYAQTNLHPLCISGSNCKWLFLTHTLYLIYLCVFLKKDRGMLLDETPLFDPALLQDLDWSSNPISFSPPISPSNPGDGLVLRPLCLADFKRGESEQGQSLTCLTCLSEFWWIFFVNVFVFPLFTGFFGVLSQLTKTGDVTVEQFSSRATFFFYIMDKM